MRFGDSTRLISFLLLSAAFALDLFSAAPLCLWQCKSSLYQLRLQVKFVHLLCTPASPPAWALLTGQEMHSPKGLLASLWQELFSILKNKK